jgi:hypothetical protein
MKPWVKPELKVVISAGLQDTTPCRSIKATAWAINK